MRAANVVFATTNSGDLERLIEERAQFDWAVVEEAGKATGGELISPLLLSHRRLIIGDHYQLPPFGSEQIVKLLESHEAVRNALLVGEEFIGRSLRDETTEEILDEIEDEENDLPAMCTDAIRVLTLFETVIEGEFKR
jgi:superfamily I DNA and/or RNA helicase